MAVTFPQFSCYLCTEVKQRREDLEAHELSVHGMLKQAHIPAGLASPVFPVPLAPPPPMDGLFPCDYRTDVKSTLQNLELHEVSVHGGCKQS